VWLTVVSALRAGAPAPKRRPAKSLATSRFDDPRGEFKVCYIGSRPVAAFAETFLRDLPTRSVSKAALRARAMSSLRLTRDVRAVQAHGSGLAQLGTTAAVSAATPYAHSQAWSRAIYEHPAIVDGIEYRSSHDDSLLCLALFDRARDAVEDVGDAPIIWQDRALVLRAIRRYRLELL
jgi:hypothetical protein